MEKRRLLALRGGGGGAGHGSPKLKRQRNRNLPSARIKGMRASKAPQSYGAASWKRYIRFFSSPKERTVTRLTLAGEKRKTVDEKRKGSMVVSGEIFRGRGTASLKTKRRIMPIALGQKKKGC